jgi:hypothetical protein
MSQPDEINVSRMIEQEDRRQQRSIVEAARRDIEGKSLPYLRALRDSIEEELTRVNDKIGDAPPGLITGPGEDGFDVLRHNKLSFQRKKLRIRLQVCERHIRAHAYGEPPDVHENTTEAASVVLAYLDDHPDWRVTRVQEEAADALDRSPSWVRKWAQRENPFFHPIPEGSAWERRQNLWRACILAAGDDP